VRLLFTCIGAAGHFHPLVPIARLAASAGHEVAFATGAAFCPTVEAAGFRAFSAGFDYAGAPLDAWFPQLQALSGDAYIRFIACEVRVQAQARQMVPDLLRLTANAYRPDLVVRDAAEYGGCIAAEILGVPHASVRTACTPSSFARRFLVADDLTHLRQDYGLSPDPQVDMPFRYMHLACEPPDFSAEDELPAPTSHALQPAVFDRPAGEELPEWVTRLSDRPTVCATLGTFVNRSVDVFATILSGLRHEWLNLIVLVGRDVDPDQFGPQPNNVHVLRYVPLSLLLPRCDLVVSHAGFNTVVTSLANGLPSVLIPLGADQPENAQTCARLGVARILGSRERTPAGVRAAVCDVLADASYRVRAERLRDAMACLPGSAHAITLLERLAAERRPILRTSQET
jgi:UDP:flavonoid glycosyltransferase YjiC (YdhE family)